MNDNIKCPICQKEFDPKKSNQKYCSKECYYQHTLEQQRAQSVRYKRQCPVCRQEFITKHSNKHFCSTACADEFNDIARFVMSKNRKKIEALILSALENPKQTLAEIMKGYPKR